jgi:tellurite resistance protein TehA-like permease
MTVALTLGSALGSVMLSYLLSATGSYVSFMILCAVATLIGAVLFYLTGRYPAQENAE